MYSLLYDLEIREKELCKTFSLSIMVKCLLYLEISSVKTIKLIIKCMYHNGNTYELQLISIQAVEILKNQMHSMFKKNLNNSPLLLMMAGNAL